MKYRQNAFTLIETLVYLALFSFLMTGIVVVTYSIFESSDRNQTKIMVQEEGNFLVAKISWALSGAKEVNSPPVGSPLSILSITKYDDSSITINTLDNCSGNSTENIFLQKGAGCFQLNNSNVQISNLIFKHDYSGGVNPERVQATFTVNAKTINGMPVSQDFSMVKYLRK